jgi:hypothetical protein
MTRIFHPWDKWEDYKNNFYGGVCEYDHDKSLSIYAALLKDIPRFEEALKIIISTWKYSCEHNLTNEAMNRIAYMGQAANALVNRAPSSVSMGGYNLLSKEEQIAADALAQKYINLWIETYEHSKKV